MAQWLQQNPSDMQKMLIIDTPEGADRIQATLRDAFPHGACYLKSKPHYLEIAPEGVDKGRSLAFLAEQLGLTRFLAAEGHAVVKVNPGGFAFRLYTLTAQDESMRIVDVRDFLCC